MKKKKEGKKSKIFADILLRYFILIIAAIPNLWIFYSVFTPITVYFVYFLLHFFFQASLSGSTILLQNHFSIELIEACIAGSAYYLLLILNLSIPKINLKNRIKILFFCFLSFLIINVVRILIMSFLLVSGSSWFDRVHLLFWYLGSVVFVIGIWFLGIKIFHVKDIPFYSDLKAIIRLRKKSS
ncbi:MAG TPA: pacearchaeosortase [Patescibacteria group bacterium]|nr:pacearchaeosortase [Patescibacteria group bacterium]